MPTPNHTLTFNLTHLPYGIIENIFRQLQPHEVLESRSFSDARHALILRRKHPAAEAAFRHVTQISRPNHLTTDNCRRAIRSEADSLCFIIASARKLESLAILNVPGNFFMRFVPNTVRHLEFLDCEGVDISPVVSGLTSITVVKPTPETLLQMRTAGHSLEKIELKAVSEEILDHVLSMLHHRAMQLSSITIYLQKVETMESERAAPSIEALQRLMGYFLIHGRQISVSVKRLYLGSIVTNQQAQDRDLLETITQLQFNPNFDWEFDMDRLCGDVLDARLAGPPNIVFYTIWFFAMVHIFGEFHGSVQLLVFDNPDEVIFHTQILGWEEDVERGMVFMDRMKVISIRHQMLESNSKARILALYYARIIKETLSLERIEVLRDLVFLPKECPAAATELFLSMTHIQCLSLTTRPRNETIAIWVDNAEFAAALPSFLEMVSTYCSSLIEIQLDDCGPYIYVSELEEKRELLMQALCSLDRFEAQKTETDVLTVRQQLESWTEDICFKAPGTDGM